MTPQVKEMRVLHTLWRQYCPTSDAEESRHDRLQFLARAVGHPVESAKDLSAAELHKVNQQLLAVLAGNPFNNAVVELETRASKRQAWKIRQIEKYLEWDGQPIRLQRFLGKKFKGTRRPEDLTKRNAWRCIEALIRIAARGLAQESYGRKEVTPAEVRDHVARVKAALMHWQQPKDEEIPF